jgi:hypothetical protein
VAKRLEDQIHKLRIKKIQFWYARKQTLNQTLYNFHLKIGKEWGQLWDIINQNITNKLDKKMNKKYMSNTLNNKIMKLREHKHHTYTTTNENKHAFYKCTENITDVAFIDSEVQLVNKGLKYNLHYKHKNWIQTLAIEADNSHKLITRQRSKFDTTSS